MKIVDIVEDTVFFDEETTFPIRPMVRVIGVAPEDGPIDSMYPGNHGGNLDTPVITEGVTLYIPIFHDGRILLSVMYMRRWEMIKFAAQV